MLVTVLHPYFFAFRLPQGIQQSFDSALLIVEHKIIGLVPRRGGGEGSEPWWLLCSVPFQAKLMAYHRCPTSSLVEYLIPSFLAVDMFVN